MKNLLSMFAALILLATVNVARAQVKGCDWFSGGYSNPCATPASGGSSSTGYMISHRQQRHSVIMPDGSYHIIVNTGTSDGYALKRRSESNHVLTIRI